MRSMKRRDTPLVCPRCRSSLQRVRRGLLDRFITLFVPVLRYRCTGCGRQTLLQRPVRRAAQRTYDGRFVLDVANGGKGDERPSRTR